MDEDDLIDQSDFEKIANDLMRERKFLAEADRLESEGKFRIIRNRSENQPYLVRYYYLNLRPFSRLVLHHIRLSDEDQALHSHPWPFQTFILSGGYWEHTVEGRFWRPKGFVGSQPSSFLHRLELDTARAGEDTWSLFLMGKKEQDWGFQAENGEIIQWQKYLGLV